MRHYSKELKEAMITKACTPGGPSVYQLSKESGIPATSLYKWVQSYRTGSMLSKNRRKTWSRKEKLKLVSESHGLEGQELGKYLRKNGLHSNQLSEWTNELMLEVVEKKKKLGRPRKDPKIAALEVENLDAHRGRSKSPI